MPAKLGPLLISKKRQVELLRSYGLGFEFTDTLDVYFKKISRLPTASAIRYDNVRVKPVDTFPYTIHFTIEPDGSIIILRVFNTYLEPLHQ